MTRALMAGLACLLLTAGPVRATSTAAPLPLLQSWSDTSLIAVDDDWSGVAGIVGFRGDGLVAEPGTDPRTITADGSGSPLDVTANRTDPHAVGLAAGVAEFELADPVVAIQGSATASAPHLLMSLDTRGRAGVTVRLLLRDIDATANDAIEPVAVQYRVGVSGDFAAVPGGYVADATSGPGEANKATQVRATLPAAGDGQALVQVRVITANAIGQDEWVGVDDIDVTAARAAVREPCPDATPASPPVPPPPPVADASPKPSRPTRPPAPWPELTRLELSPETFTPARRGPAVIRRGRAGAVLRFRLSRPALVRFEAMPAGGERFEIARKRGGGTAGAPSGGKSGAPNGSTAGAPSGGTSGAPSGGAAGARDRRGTDEFFGPSDEADRFAMRLREPASGGRFFVRGRRGRNRVRFSGRVRGRPLAAGKYLLRAVAVDRAGRTSAPIAVRFRIDGPEDEEGAED